MNDIFSPLERLVIKYIGKTHTSYSTIAFKVYYQKKNRPDNEQNTIGTIIRRINNKCKRHSLPWFINGMGVTKQGRTIWKDEL